MANISAKGIRTPTGGKHRTGKPLDNPVLLTESRVTLVDAYLAASVLVGVALNALLGWSMPRFQQSRTSARALGSPKKRFKPRACEQQSIRFLLIL
jgi:hypothetical protein